MSAPLVVLVGSPGFWRRVWVQDGHGFIHLDGRWQPLTEAPGLGGRVLVAAEVAEVVREVGAPDVRKGVTICCEPDCDSPIDKRHADYRCRPHFEAFLKAAREFTTTTESTKP